VETRTRTPNRQGEQTLAARPFRTRRPELAAIADGAPVIREPAPRAEAERRRGTDAEPGRWYRWSAGPTGSATPCANRTKGSDAERRTRFLPGQALKGEPRGRARLRHTGERATGARRRGRQERRGRNFDPEEATPGAVARRLWVASWGNKPRESRWRRRTASRSIGSHSEAGRKSEGGTRAIQMVSRPAREDHEVDEPRGGIAKPMRR